MTSRGYLPPISDNKDTPSLREQLESIRAEMGVDVTLADVVRTALREFIARHNEGE